MMVRLLGTMLLLGFFQQAGGQGLPAAPAAQAVSTFRISGRVVDAISGQPLARTTVSINASRVEDSLRVEVSGEGGEFAFENVPAGKYLLTGRRRGYLTQNYQEHEGFSTAIVAGPELDSENLRFEMRPGASISGNVTDEAGEAVRHADVLLFRQTLFGGKRGTSMMRRGTADDEGHYHFGHLVPGTFFVGVSAQPWYALHGLRRRPQKEEQENGEGGLQPQIEENQSLDVAYPVTFFSNARDISGAAAISVHPGDAEVADFTLRTVPALHLLVKTNSGDPTQNVNLQVMQTVTENNIVPVIAGVTQIAPGLVEVTGVPPGRINLEEFAYPPQGGKETARRSQVVQVSSDTEIDAAESSASIVVSGMLKMDDGTSVPQPTHVRLRNSATGEEVDTDVLATGEFSFKNSPVGTGEYELMIMQPQGLFIKSLASGNVKTWGRSFQIVTERDVDVTINAAKGNGRITGYAMKDGKRAAGVMVVLAPEDLHGNPALFRRDQSDSDGSFTLSSVVSGKYTVMAIENGWDLEWADADVLRKYLAGGEKVEMGANGKIEIKVKVQ